MSETLSPNYGPLRQINREIEFYKTKQVQVVPGLYYNQKDTIEDIYFYYNSKYKTGSIDDEGDRKYFFNINRNPCKVLTKAIDFDTKNIRLLTTEAGDSLKTWFMERDLKYWMRKEQFGKVLNRIFTEIPIFGSVVLKIVQGKPYFVDLRNFIVEQGANSLEESSYITEIHHFTPGEFRAVAKKMGWKTEDVLDEFYKMKDESRIRVYERYGEIADDNNNYSYKRLFIADVGVDRYDEQERMTIEHPGVLLSIDDWTPEKTAKLYWEFHMNKIPGRWLGFGIVEELFEPQIAQNVNTNLQAKSSYWAALRLFFTRDSGMNRNSINDARNGDLLTGDDPVTQIDMSDRNLAFFNQQDQRWMANRDELTFSYDVTQGERLPAGTPLGSAQLATSQALTYFELIQENLALDIKEMLYEVIIPTFQAENTPEHTLRLVGKDLDTYNSMIKNQLVLEEMVRQVQRGKMPTEDTKLMVETAVTATLQQDSEKLLKIPKNFYKDIKYDVEIDITGESTDTRVKQATLFALLQAMTADPTMTTDPTKREFLYMMAENGGINPNNLFREVKEPQVEAAEQIGQRRAGGGVSAPQMSSPLAGQAMSTM